MFIVVVIDLSAGGSVCRQRRIRASLCRMVCRKYLNKLIVKSKKVGRYANQRKTNCDATRMTKIFQQKETGSPKGKCVFKSNN